MNEELQKALATLLAKTTSAAEAGVSFLQAELPEVIQQLLMWKAVQSASQFALLLALAGLMILVSRKFWVASKAYKPTYAFDSGKSDRGFGAFLFSMFALFCLFGAAHSLIWLQILIAPKVYLIEYAASLAK